MKNYKYVFLCLGTGFQYASFTAKNAVATVAFVIISSVCYCVPVIIDIIGNDKEARMSAIREKRLEWLQTEVKILNDKVEKLRLLLENGDDRK